MPPLDDRSGHCPLSAQKGHRSAVGGPREPVAACLTPPTRGSNTVGSPFSIQGAHSTLPRHTQHSNQGSQPRRPSQDDPRGDKGWWKATRLLHGALGTALPSHQAGGGSPVDRVQWVGCCVCLTGLQFFWPEPLLPWEIDKKSPGHLVLLTRAHSLLSPAALQWDLWLMLGQRVLQPSVHDRGLGRSPKIKSAISTPGRPAP